MKARICAYLLGLLCLCSFPAPLLSQSQDKPTPSAHQKGPDGLEGWTLNWPNPDRDGELIPFTLIIARNGHTIRRIEGDPTIWKWIFWADGKQVAYMTGSLHFSATCILADLATGKRLGSYDCYRDLPPQKPDWVDALEASE
jgi:hypothetical protein